jgi:hypothetical protein
LLGTTRRENASLNKTNSVTHARSTATLLNIEKYINSSYNKKINNSQQNNSQNNSEDYVPTDNIKRAIVLKNNNINTSFLNKNLKLKKI